MVVAPSRGTELTLRELRRLPLSVRLRRPEYWQWVRFIAFGRLVPAMLFGLLGYRQWVRVTGRAHALPAHPAPWTVADALLPGTLYLLFCSIPVGLYLTRPAPVRRDGRLLPRTAAFVGTLMQLVVGAVVGGQRQLWSPPQWALTLADLLAIAALAGAVWGLLHLRRNLSIVPEARTLTTSGPYRLVRHPLYACEIGAALALTLSAPYLTTVVTTAAFVAVQYLRSHYEERLLRATFPEYGAYARRTRRLIPFVC